MSRASAVSLTLAAGMFCAFPAFAQLPGGAAGGDARNDLTSIAPPAAATRPEAPDIAARPVATSTPSRQSGKGNPLWGIPLESLRATRERPLFSVSRRPPPPPVAYVEPVVSAPPPPPAPPLEPEKPLMTLVGVVHSAEADIGIFLDRNGPSVIRLRVGQEDRGWVVRSVDSRAATLEKDSQQVKLELPARNAQGGPAGSEIAAINPSVPSPRAFFPR